MEINKKIIPFPFWCHINYANCMRMNKRLPPLIRKTKEDGCGAAVVYLRFKKK